MKVFDLPDEIRNDSGFPYTLRHCTGVFTPVRTDNLRPELLDAIGKRFRLSYAGTNDETCCMFPGEITVLLEVEHLQFLPGWIPLSEISDLEVDET